MKPYLLILMRNDLDSMSPGRAAAQASHATSAFTLAAEARENPVPEADVNPLPGYAEWRESTPQGFGTAIVVGVSGFELKYYSELAAAFKYQTEVINDPTYGVKDGNVMHSLPLDTCGYVFVNADDNAFYVLSKKLPLF